MDFQPREKPSFSNLSKGDDELATKQESPGNNSPSISSHTDSEGSDRIDDGQPHDSLRSNVLRLSTSPNEVITWEALAVAHTRTSIGSSASRPPEYEVLFEPDDPENPKNWPVWYKGWIIFCVSFSTWGKHQLAQPTTPQPKKTSSLSSDGPARS